MQNRFRSIFRLPVDTHHLATYGPLWLVPFILMAPAWLTGRAIFWGTPILQFVPWGVQAWKTLSSGHLPLWNPLVGMGAPLLANYQSALFYPPNWILLFLAALGGAPLLAWGQALVIAFHLAWAGVGMGRLAQRLGLSSLAGTVSGLAFGLCGYLVARASFLSINAAAAWLPWILLGGLEATLHVQGRPGYPPGKRRRFPSLLTFALGMQLLAGHAQTTWYSLLLAGLWAIFLGFSFTRGFLNLHGPVSSPSEGSPQSFRVPLIYSLPRSWQPIAWLILAGLLASALAAGQLLPTAEYLLHSQRESGLDLDFALGYSFSPWHFLTLALPDFFGNPGHGNYSGYANYWESAIYIGLLPFLLALRAILSSFRKRYSARDHRPVIWFLLLVTVISFAFALGKNTPLYPWLYQHVPTFDMFLGPARWSLWAEFALALLAGYGVQFWQRPEGKSLYWTRLGTAGSFAAIGGALLARVFSTQVNPVQVSAAATAGVWAAGAGILSLVMPRQDPLAQPRWRWGVITLICADLLVAHIPLNPPVTLDLYRSPSPRAADLQNRADGQRLFLNADDEYALKFKRFFLFDTYHISEDWLNLRQVYLPNSNMLDGLPSANNFDPLVPARYARWMNFLAQADQPTLDSLLPRMGIGLVEQVDDSQPYGIRFTTVQSLGRARWVPCATPARDADDAWSQVIHENNTPGFALDYVILEGMASFEDVHCDPQGAASVEIMADHPGSLAVKVQSSAAGWLVVADTWYPGWVARVDGVNSPILRADYLFRAVPVQAGEHEIIMQYRPMSFYLGVSISLAAWILLGWITLAGSTARGSIPTLSKPTSPTQR